MTKRKLTISSFALLAAAAVGVAGVANAGGLKAAVSQTVEGSGGADASDAREQAIVNGARVSLGQAVAAAEANTGLKATEAGVDDEGAGALYEVSVSDGAVEKTVLVDTQTGRVTSVAADAEEAEGAEAGDAD